MVALWTVAFVEQNYGGLWLVLLSIVMLLVGGGLVPPFLGVATGLISEFNNHNRAKQWH